MTTGGSFDMPVHNATPAYPATFHAPLPSASATRYRAARFSGGTGMPPNAQPSAPNFTLRPFGLRPALLSRRIVD